MKDITKPIFIVGCTNSGTKCLYHSLVLHHNLFGLINELHFYGFQPNIEGRLNRLFALYPCFKTNYNTDPILYNSYDSGPLDPKVVRDSIASIINNENINLLGTGNRILIKDPKLSIRIKWLKKVFPDCKIIGIVRNPYSVIEGIIRKLSIHGDVPMTLDVPTAASQWAVSNSIMLLDSKNIKDFYLLRYEDMISADVFPGNNFWSDLLNFLDLDLDFNIPNSSPFSNFDKTRDEKSLSNLSKWDIEFINFYCSDLITKLGYVKREV